MKQVSPNVFVCPNSTTFKQEPQMAGVTKYLQNSKIKLGKNKSVGKKLRKGGKGKKKRHSKRRKGKKKKRSKRRKGEKKRQSKHKRKKEKRKSKEKKEKKKNDYNYS